MFAVSRISAHDRLRRDRLAATVYRTEVADRFAIGNQVTAPPAVPPQPVPSRDGDWLPPHSDGTSAPNEPVTLTTPAAVSVLLWMQT